jgi:TusA-related sulfurtransferase
MVKEEVLDVRGMICPFPLLKTLKRLEEIKEDILKGGLVLRVITDHPPATRTIPFEVSKRGLKVSVEKKEKGVYEILIKA